MLQPEYLGARKALCWAHALGQQPQLALLHCDVAVDHVATVCSRDAHTIMYARLGCGSDAANDLQLVLEWLMRRPESLRAPYGSARAEWLQLLQAGKNPIDDAVLEKLRKE